MDHVWIVCRTYSDVASRIVTAYCANMIRKKILSKYLKLTK